MNFISRVYFRIPAQVLQFTSMSRPSSCNLSTSSFLSNKYGKLINDHVTNAFYLPVGENTSATDMAAVLYDKQKGFLNLHHTEVPKSLEGKGIGHDIAKEVFEYCSARNLKVVLTCEFLQQFYKENPQYKDLVLVREKMNI